MFSPTTTARIFTVTAFVEAASWVGLLIGMFLKHVTGTTEVGVQIFGMAHGIIVLIYVAATALAYWKLRWTWTELTVALIAAVPPLLTIPAERWLRRRGALDDPAERPDRGDRAARADYLNAEADAAAAEESGTPTRAN